MLGPMRGRKLKEGLFPGGVWRGGGGGGEAGRVLSFPPSPSVPRSLPLLRLADNDSCSIVQNGVISEVVVPREHFKC